MMSSLPKRVTIVEVGPRDGLQNEAAFVSTAQKIGLIERLADAGLSFIEATSFVHPKAVPQLADADAVIGELETRPGLTISALVPNERGLDRALAAGVKRIALFTAASETFTRRNIRMSIADSLAVFRAVSQRAVEAGVSVRAYLSTCFVCPFEGDISARRVAELTEQLLELGADEIALSDTIGAAAPRDVFAVGEAILNRVSAPRLALHLHDTYGTALSNVLAGLQMGITTYDAAVAGLGGCPFAPGAAGNLATEDLVYFLDRMGITTEVDLARVLDAADAAASLVGSPPRSRQWSRVCGKAQGSSRDET